VLVGIWPVGHAEAGKYRSRDLPKEHARDPNECDALC